MGVCLFPLVPPRGGARVGARVEVARRRQSVIPEHRDAPWASKPIRLLPCALLVALALARVSSGQGARPAQGTDGAGEQPLWELGVFGGVARMPHYRGADEYRTYVLPLPYLIYRGEILQADREGVRGTFAATRHFESSISFYGNPPVSGDNRARQGMPELGAVGEAGPSLTWFFQDRAALSGLHLKVAGRGVVSLDGSDLTYRGIHGGVNLLYDDNSRWDTSGFRYGVNFGLDLADGRYNEYVYGVPLRHSLPDRPAYHAMGGYGGFGLSAYGARRLSDSFAVALYARWDNLGGAVFDDSPLVRTESNLVLGTALVWRVAKSGKTVPWRRNLAE